MAEESPRPAVEEEEDSEESAEEEGEEAAEAPAISESRTNEAPSPKDETNKPAGNEPKENRAPVPVKPLLTAPAAFKNTAPAPYTPPALPAAAAAVTSGVNVFANDGSFLELFKKKMEQKPAGSNEAAAVPEEKKPEPDKRRPISFVGKRRGGAKLALKTGMVAKKPKTDDEEVVVQKGGAWAQYMAEVKKYKAHQCSDDDKTRPLVK